MRKLKLQVQMSIDGFITGTKGEMDWMVYPWTDDITEYVVKFNDPIDTILLGRTLAEGFIPHWAIVVTNTQDPDYVFALKYANVPKIVFTKTLDKSIWDNTVLAKGDLVEEVTKLKKQDGKDMVCYGGSTFVSNLVKEKLIDELHLFVNPAAIGSGLPIFHTINAMQNYTIDEVQKFDCGIVLMKYLLKK